ncbi:MAG: DUF4230 domain-containing protein [Flavobacteriales bacterium]|nr:DUF4230 domain-containing protein [Flavobacteriales bacterium]
MRRITLLLAIIATALLAFFITREVYRPGQGSERVSASVLIERMRPVLKLVTVEGEFNELYHHKDSWNWRYSVPGFTEKQAILRVKARVSVGYDLDGMRITTDEATRTVTLLAPPEPQVLSIEHEVDYYDISNGIFNRFSPQELTALNTKARQQVLDKVPTSGLFDEADKQRGVMVEALRAIVESAGWTLEAGYTPKDGRTRLKG